MSLPTIATMAGNDEAHSNGIRSRNYNNKKKNEENWMEDIRGSLMIVATVIATLTFQIAINPPGGVWQSDTGPNGGCAANKTCKAGTSILASGDGHQTNYEVFILLCTISFSASLTIILFLMTGFPLRYRLVMWSFIITMCISVTCLAGAYIIAIFMVTNPFDDDAVLSKIIQYYVVFWGGLVALLCLGLFLRSLCWLVKMCCCC